MKYIAQILHNPKLAPWVCIGLSAIASGWLLLDPRSVFSTMLLIIAMLMTYLANANKWLKLALAAAVLCAVVPVAGHTNLGLTFLFISIFLNSTLAMGLNLVVGFAGLLDLGYIAFFAGGAYMYAFFGSKQAAAVITAHASWFPFGGWWFWAALPVTVAFAALLGIMLGLPVLRLRGDYLAIVTLGFGEIINVLARNLDHPINLTNGVNGIGNITSPVLFGWKLNKDIHFYFIGLILAVLTIIIMSRMERSRIGRAWAAMREDDTAAQAMGLNLTRLKLLAFATGAAFAGASGMLFAVKQQFINPDSFTFLESVGIIAMVILGGLGNIPGAIMGAVTVTVIRLQILQRFSDWLQHTWHLPDAFDFVKYQPLEFGLILILVMLFRREGLLPSQGRSEDITAIEAAVDPPATGVGAPSVGGRP